MVHRRGDASLAAFVRDQSIQVVHFGAAPLGDVLGHGSAPVYTAAACLQHLVELVEDIGFVGSAPKVGVYAADLLNLVVQGLPHLHRFLADVDAHVAGNGALRHTLRAEPRHGRHRVADAVLGQFGPAFPPEVVGRLGGVDAVQPTRHFLRPWGDVPVHFADPEHEMAVVASHCSTTSHMARLPQGYLNMRGDAAKLPLIADDGGDGLVVHAVLR